MAPYSLRKADSNLLDTICFLKSVVPPLCFTCYPKKYHIYDLLAVFVQSHAAPTPQAATSSCSQYCPESGGRDSPRSGWKHPQEVRKVVRSWSTGSRSASCNHCLLDDIDCYKLTNQVEGHPTARGTALLLQALRQVKEAETGKACFSK